MCRDTTSWLTAALFPGRTSVTDNISYGVQYKEIKGLFRDLNMTFSKITHIFRVSGARALDMCGVDDSVSTQPNISVERFRSATLKMMP